MSMNDSTEFNLSCEKLTPLILSQNQRMTYMWNQCQLLCRK